MDFSEIEAARVRGRISCRGLAQSAGVVVDVYYRARAGKTRPTKRTLGRLEKALGGAPRRRSVGTRNVEPMLILSTFRGWAAHFAGKLGVDPATALASDPGLRANSDPAWRLAAQVRELAAYCTVTELDLGAARVARAIGVTRAAVSLMLRRVEDQRDDPTVEEMVEAAARLISGRRE